MSVNLYDTRTLLRTLEQMYPPQSFLLDLFFTETVTHDTEYVDIDIVKGRRKLAPFVSPLNQGKAQDRTGYVTHTFKPPYIKPKRSSSAADLLKRQAGETLYASASLQQRAAMLMVKDLREMDEECTRREEWMAMKQLTTGVIPVVGEGVNVEIDILLESTHKLVNTDLIANGWADPSTSKPLDDLDNIQLLISQDSGLDGSIAILGQTAFQDFVASEQVIAEWLTFKNVGTELQRQANVLGAIFQGIARGKQVWTYNEFYTDDDGQTKAMIPATQLVVASRGARAIRHYGAIQDLAAPGGAQVRRFPKSWEEQDPSVRYVMLQSAPLPIFHQVDGFAYATVEAA